MEEAWIVQALGAGTFGQARCQAGFRRGQPLALKITQPPFLSFPQSLIGAGWTGTVLRSKCQLMPGFPQGASPTGPSVHSGSFELFLGRATSSSFEGFPASYNASVPWDLQGNPSSDPHPLTKASRIWARGQGGASH